MLDDVGGVGGGDRAEVDHAGGRRMQRCEAARRGLDRAHLVGPDAREAGNAVGARPALEVVEALQVGGPGRDHELAAALRGDPALVAVRVQRRRAFHAQPRLQRARLVVEAGVDDAAVVRRLMGAERPLPLEHDHPHPAQRERTGGREPDDAAAHHRDVVH